MNKKKTGKFGSWTRLLSEKWTAQLIFKTHTDQYLYFGSHHPLHHKLGVVRTLIVRMEKVVTEEEDKKVEKDKIRQAVKNMGTQIGR